MVDQLSFTTQFPNLFQTSILKGAQLSYQFELCDFPPPTNLISNVSLVPFIGDQCLAILLQNGNWEIPGGTLEPGESYLDTIRRELLEEAGARLVTFELLKKIVQEVKPVWQICENCKAWSAKSGKNAVLRWTHSKSSSF